MSNLTAVLSQLSGKISRYRNSRINEQDTKATLVEPILRELGWDTEDFEEVRREYKRKRSDKPVDYALLLLREPRLFVEAKALGQNLDDRKWANQIMGYASVAGVEWVVMTNGDEYRIYNSHATVPVEQKLFRSVRVSDTSDAQVAETLNLLSKGRMEENEIDVLWNAHRVDSQVQSVMTELFADEPDPSIVRLVNRRTRNLTQGEIRAGLRRLQVRFDLPTELLALGDDSSGATKRTERKSKAQKPKKRTKSPTKRSYDATLSDLLKAGIVRAPLKLTKQYKGNLLEAEVRVDGTVHIDGKEFRTPSTAAEYARGTITGRRMNTNGWVFWQYENGDGRVVYLDEARQAFLKRTS